MCWGLAVHYPADEPAYMKTRDAESRQLRRQGPLDAFQVEGVARRLSGQCEQTALTLKFQPPQRLLALRRVTHALQRAVHQRLRAKLLRGVLLEASQHVGAQARERVVPTRQAGSRQQALGQLLFQRSEEHTSELQSPCNLVCRLL